MASDRIERAARRLVAALYGGDVEAVVAQAVSGLTPQEATSALQLAAQIARAEAARRNRHADALDEIERRRVVVPLRSRGSARRPGRVLTDAERAEED
jgi:hypothetical protein